eukprot:jgi/Ulvmu1/11650/UM008_0054.1
MREDRMAALLTGARGSSQPEQQRTRQLHKHQRVKLLHGALCTLITLGSSMGAYAELYFVEPPSWTKTDNWRPAAAPGSQYYWHDTSFAPSCQWDIGRLLNDALFVPACTWTAGCSIPGCTNTCVANMFQRPEALYKEKNPYQLVSIQQSAVPTVPGAAVGQGFSRYPIMRDTLAVDAYRCPIIAATILELAKSVNLNISATEGLSAPGLGCPTDADVDLVADLLDQRSARRNASLPFQSPADNAIAPFTYEFTYNTSYVGTPSYGALSFAGTAAQAKDLIARYCNQTTIGVDLQEAIYNVVPAYQDIFFDPGLGSPSGALKTVCRDNETIIDELPPRSSMIAIREAYNQTLQSIDGAQCYGDLAQFLDPQDTPWRDRLLRDPTSRPLWRPAARRMLELHQKCRAIVDEGVCKEAQFPEQQLVIDTFLTYMSGIDNAGDWVDPYQEIFLRPPPPAPPAPPPRAAAPPGLLNATHAPFGNASANSTAPPVVNETFTLSQASPTDSAAPPFAAQTGGSDPFLDTAAAAQESADAPRGSRAAAAAATAVAAAVLALAVLV